MEEKLAVETIKYLYSIDEYLKTNIETGGLQNQLRQNLLQRARLLELKNRINLPKKTQNTRLKCPKCFMPRDQGLGAYKLRRNKISKFHKKIVKKMDTGEVLTKYQEKYLKKQKSKSSQILEVHCKICGYTVIKDIENPNVGKKSKEKKEVIVEKNLQKGKNHQSKQIGGSKNHLNVTDVKSNKQSQKRKLQQKSIQKELPKKVLSHKNKVNKFNKMNLLLSTTSKIKNTGLKDFIKSIT